MTNAEAIPKSQKEDLIEFIYRMTLEEKEKQKESTAIPERSDSAQ